MSTNNTELVYEFGSSVEFADADTTASNPTLAASYYLGNTPPGIPSSGTVDGSGTGLLNETPSSVTFGPSSSGGGYILGFFLLESGNGAATLTPGESFTCSVYDNSTLIGTATGSVSGNESSGSTQLEESCEAGYNQANDSSSQTAFVTLTSSTYNSADKYTFVLSH